MTRPSNGLSQNGRSALDAEIEGAYTVWQDSELPPRVALTVDAVAAHMIFEAGFLYGAAAAHRESGAMREIARDMLAVFERIEGNYTLTDAGHVAIAEDTRYPHSDDCPHCEESRREDAKRALLEAAEILDQEPPDQEPDGKWVDAWTGESTFPLA